MRRILTLFATLSSFAGSAAGWGCDGHQMIALIARAHLTPAASAAVDRLLRENPIDPALDRYCKERPADPMADSATWADDARNVERTGEWHYIDIPLSIEKGDAMVWCPPVGPLIGDKDRTGCVIDALEYEWSILRDKAQPAPARAKALRYVIHLTEDLHQPLHTEDNNDKGGNCTALRFFAETRPANLHSIWDSKILQRDLEEKHTTQPAYAAAIDERFAAKWPAWGDSKVDLIAWAWEGHALARNVAYADLNPAIPVEAPETHPDCDAERGKIAAMHIIIGDSYFDAALPAIDEQLAKAGYRLAGLLNQTFQ